MLLEEGRDRPLSVRCLSGDSGQLASRFLLDDLGGAGQQGTGFSQPQVCVSPRVIARWGLLTWEPSPQGWVCTGAVSQGRLLGAGEGAVDCERHQKHLVLGNGISWAVFEAGQSSARRQDLGQILSLPGPSCLLANSGPL